MTRDVLPDALAERRFQELERLVRAHLAGLLVGRRKGTVILRLEVEAGEITWHSAVSSEQKPLTRGGT